MTTITTKSDIDILDLFVHDQHDTGSLNASELAEALTAHIQSALTERLNNCPADEWSALTALKVQTPDETNLDRFVLGTHSMRCYAWDAVKTMWTAAGLPDEIAGSLESLQRSTVTWGLSDGKLRRQR